MLQSLCLVFLGGRISHLLMRVFIWQEGLTTGTWPRLSIASTLKGFTLLLFIIGSGINISQNLERIGRNNLYLSSTIIKNLVKKSHTNT